MNGIFLLILTLQFQTALLYVICDIVPIRLSFVKAAATAVSAAKLILTIDNFICMFILFIFYFSQLSKWVNGSIGSDFT